jgi:hypothetical protein
LMPAAEKNTNIYSFLIKNKTWGPWKSSMTWCFPTRKNITTIQAVYSYIGSNILICPFSCQ